MESSEHGLLDELLAPRRESWPTFPSAVNEFFLNGWSFDETQVLGASNPPFPGLTPPADPSLSSLSLFNEVPPFADCNFSAHPFADDSLYDHYETPPPPIPREYPSIADAAELGLPANTDLHTHSLQKTNINFSTVDQEDAAQEFNKALFGDKKGTRPRRLEGQPSKNLMAERRRRKRLNDRLSMLRSIVPKISKMDRTSILGDTIDYMKELLENISKLQEEDGQEGVETVTLTGNAKGRLKTNDQLLVRNCPKFDVERRNIDTRIKICCAAKPGLLLSTINTLEALGLDIQQCVISCFSDFSMQASCSEAAEGLPVTSSEDIKQTLFRNAGYGGRCL